MNEILNIFRAVGRADLYALQPQQLIRWLSGQIKTVPLVSDCNIWYTDIRRSAEGSTRVLYGPTGKVPVNSISLYSKTLVFGDLTPVTHRVLNGPLADDYLPLAVNETALVIRVYLEDDITWFVLKGSSALCEPEQIDLWLAISEALAYLIWPSRRSHPPHSVRGMRKRFYDQLFNYEPKDASLSEELRYVCNAWRDVSGADWVWLWIHNAHFDEFELTSLSIPPDSHDDIQRDLLDRSARPGAKSIGAYCALRREPEIVDDVSSWQRTVGATHYTISLSETLVRLGAPAVTIVPLFAPSPLYTELTVMGAVSLHFKDLTKRVPHHPSALSGMGSATSIAIRQVQTAELNKFLLALNRLEDTHLSNIVTRPDLARTEYLHGVFSLLRRRLQIRATSVFYRKQFEDCIECIATTGLEEGESGKIVTMDELEDVVYGIHDGRTGECYAMNRTIVDSTRLPRNGYRRRFVERRSLIDESGFDPILLVPIPRQNDVSTSDPDARDLPECRPLGVIRCVEHESPVVENRLSNFKPLDVQTVEFIARQIAPVLHVFEQRIQREILISVVKHDLYTPINAVSYMLRRIQRDLDNNKPVSMYDVLNAQYTAELANNLVHHLELDSGFGASNRTAVFLEGDIIARYKNMLEFFAKDAKGMSIAYGGLRNIPKLNVCKEQIERVIFNVTTNAIKYGSENTVIHIEGEVRDNSYVVRVINEGDGIDPGEEELIFRRFYRGRIGRSISAAGAGLGLAIARRIMRAHDGDIRLRRGRRPTIFELLFPRELKAHRVEE